MKVFCASTSPSGRRATCIDLCARWVVLTQALLLLGAPALPEGSPAWTLLNASPTAAQIGNISVLSPNGDIYSAGGSGCAGIGAGSCVVKTNASGSLLFAVSLAGAAAVALDSAGNLYVAGVAGYSATGFVTTAGAYESTPPGAPNPFVCKLDGNDGHVIFCTFVDIVSNIVVDATGNSYLAGGCVNAAGLCAEALNPTGTAVVYRTTISNSISDALAMAVDANSNLFVAAGALTKLNASGVVVATSSNFGNYAPIELALDPTGDPEVLLENFSNQNGFLVSRYSADLSAALFNTPLQLGRFAAISAMAIDSTGVTDLLGATASANFAEVHPTQVCLPPSATAGIYDAFLVRLDNAGNILQSTFLQTQFGAALGQAAIFAATPTAASVLVAAASGEELLTLGPGSEVVLGCFGNGASFVNAALAPNEIVSLFGDGLAPAAPVTAQPGTNGIYPFQLNDTQVTFDGVAAPLLYASGSQINLVTPGALQGKTTTHVCAQVGSATTNCIDIPVQPAAPGIFTTGTFADGIPYAAALNQDGTINSAQNPAAVGSIVSLFITGLGSVTPAQVDGGLNPLPPAAQDLAIQVQYEQSSPSGGPAPNGIADVLYAGPAPLEVEGLAQINVQVPSTPGPVDPNPVIFTVVVTSSGQTFSVSSAEAEIYSTFTTNN